MENILKKAKAHVTKLLSQQLGSDYLFHNLDWTKKMVNKAEEILKNYNEKELDKNEVLMAVWFLNTGFSKEYNDPVAKSTELTQNFLKENGLQKNAVDGIVCLIKAAWSDKEPENLSEAIVKDSRTFYYGSKNFEELLELHRMELQNLGQNPPKLQEWRKQYIETLRTKHRFYTDYAKENWHAKKEENIISLIGAVTKAVKTKQKEKLKVRLKNQSPERAIQSLYRTQLRNHIKLSDIADTKANILLSVNAIIISLLLANLIPKLGNPANSYLIYPTVIFLIFSIASMIMSVLATRPKIENDKIIDETIKKGDTNYLFFGNFHTNKFRLNI